MLESYELNKLIQCFCDKWEDYGAKETHKNIYLGVIETLGIKVLHDQVHIRMEGWWCGQSMTGERICVTQGSDSP